MTSAVSVGFSIGGAFALCLQGGLLKHPKSHSVCLRAGAALRHIMLIGPMPSPTDNLMLSRATGTPSETLFGRQLHILIKNIKFSVMYPQRFPRRHPAWPRRSLVQTRELAKHRGFRFRHGNANPQNSASSLVFL